MRRVVSASLVIFFVFLSVIIFCSCNSASTSATEDGVMTEVFDEESNLTGYERVYHNSNGDISRVDRYTVDKVYENYTIYEYDDDDRLIQETTYAADGLGLYYYTYEYDDSNNVIEKGCYTASDGFEIHLYDADGTETERYYYGKNDELVKHEVFVDGAWSEAAVDDEIDSDNRSNGN